MLCVIMGPKGPSFNQLRNFFETKMVLLSVYDIFSIEIAIIIVLLQCTLPVKMLGVGNSESCSGFLQRFFYLSFKVILVFPT